MGEGIMPRNKATANSELMAAIRRLGSCRLCETKGTLYQRGHDVGGVFLVEQGWVKLSCSSDDGPNANTEIAGPGSILALSETMSGRPYKCTARAVNEVRTCFVPRPAFQAEVRSNPQLCWAIVEFLSHDLHALYNRLQTVAFHSRVPAGSDSRPS
jgi:CRP/FNR family transcriptional regulator, cyclic AMP receptor protein